MSDIFVSYVAEDTVVAEAIATGLEQAGYTAWYYTRDSQPGPSHLLQTAKAIEASRVTVLVLSPSLVEKPKEVRLEVVSSHDAGKPFIPVLVGLSWAEFKERLPDIKQVLGGSVAVTLAPSKFEELNSRILAGLKLMGIEPQVRAPASPIAIRYPYPLAAAYLRRMQRGVSLEQSFQQHQGLGDLAEVIARFLGAIAVAEYRADSATPGNEDPEVEGEIARWPAGIGPWASLTHGILGLYGENARPPLGSLHAFFFQKKLRQDGVSAAIAAVGAWLGGGPPRRAPFSHEEFLDLLGEYQASPAGWAARGAVLSPRDTSSAPSCSGAPSSRRWTTSTRSPTSGWSVCRVWPTGVRSPASRPSTTASGPTWSLGPSRSTAHGRSRTTTSISAAPAPAGTRRCSTCIPSSRVRRVPRAGA